MKSSILRIFTITTLAFLILFSILFYTLIIKENSKRVENRISYINSKLEERLEDIDLKDEDSLDKLKSFIMLLNEKEEIKEIIALDKDSETFILLRNSPSQINLRTILTNVSDYMIVTKNNVRYYQKMEKIVTKDNKIYYLVVSYNMDNILQDIRISHVFIIVPFVLTFFAYSLILSYVFNRKVERPIKAFNKKMKLLSEENYIDSEEKCEITRMIELCDTLVNHLNIRSKTLTEEVEVRKKMEEQIKRHEKDLELLVEERTSELQDLNDELIDKNIELLNLQGQIIQREKLTSIGQLSAGIAHEMNNPLAFVSANFDALERYLDMILNKEVSGEDRSFIISDIPLLLIETKDGLNRLSNIIQNLKEFSEYNGNDVEYNINLGVERVLTLLKFEYSEFLTVHTFLESDSTIKGNKEELNELIFAIVKNSIKAIELEKKEGIIRIDTFDKDDKVVIKVEDSGIGMNNLTLKNVFDPFFKGEEFGDGMGLGLHKVYRIVNKYKGSIDISSIEGVGTRVRIEFPSSIEGECGDE